MKLAWYLMFERTFYVKTFGQYLSGFQGPIIHFKKLTQINIRKLLSIISECTIMAIKYHLSSRLTIT